MRALGLPIVLLVAGCNFGSPIPDQPGTDGPPGIDARPDGPRPDAPPGPGRRKRITIPDANVTGAHTAFPLWISLTDAEIAARATGSGADIHFTRLDGAPLAHEIQSWDKATGRLRAWVRVDLLDGQNTVLEVRYGDLALAIPPSPAMVFVNGFAAVWHLEDTLAATTVVDARGQHNGTIAGGLGPVNQVAAQLGGGIDYTGPNHRIQFTNPYIGPGSHTISAWVNQRTGVGFDSIVTVGNNATNESRWFHSHYLNGVSAGFFGNDLPGSVADVDNVGWVLLHWTFDAMTGQSRVYLDGAEVDGRVIAGNPGTAGTAGFIGYAPNQWGPGGNNPCTLNGVLDEVRLATVPRNLGWVAAEYANQNTPAMFYMVGNEERLP